MSHYPLAQEHHQNHAEKRRRIGRETNSHGPTSEVALVDVDLVVFGRFEIKPWFPSPYVLDSHEFFQPATTACLPPPPSIEDPQVLPSKEPSDTNLTENTQQPQSIEHVVPTSPSHNNNNKQIERSQTPDSLSSLENVSTNNQPYLTIPKKNLYPSSQSLLPSSASDLNLTSPRPTNGSSIPIHHSSDSSLNPPPASSSPFLKLYVCDGCLKYLASVDAFRQHKIRCKMTHPPGRKVYQSGTIIIREIDGSKAKLYSQCLCLFGKLFIDHKYIFFDVEGFKFYVLTKEEEEENTTSNLVVGGGGKSKSKQKKETIMGFFSKEKISYDGYNLACIVTLPPYQKKGYGTLMIAFSYELDRFEAGNKDEHGLPKQEGLYLGTPERPLSTLGAKGYLSYWTAVLVRFFRTLFPPPPPRIGGFSDRRGSSSSTIIEMSLEEIARSTRLRPDDAAFALISSGLTRFRKKNNNNNSLSDDDEEDDGYFDNQSGKMIKSLSLLETW